MSLSSQSVPILFLTSGSVFSERVFSLLSAAGYTTERMPLSAPALADRAAGLIFVDLCGNPPNRTDCVQEYITAHPSVRVYYLLESHDDTAALSGQLSGDGFLFSGFSDEAILTHVRMVFGRCSETDAEGSPGFDTYFNSAPNGI